MEYLNPKLLVRLLRYRKGLPSLAMYLIPFPGQIFHSEKWQSSVLMTMVLKCDKNIPIKQSKKYIKLFQLSSPPLPSHLTNSSSHQRNPTFTIDNKLYNNMNNTDITKEQKEQEQVPRYLQGGLEYVNTKKEFYILGSDKCSQLNMPKDVMDDVSLLRKQLKLLSKTALKLSSKLYEQSEQLDKTKQELQNYRIRSSELSLKQEQLQRQIAKLNIVKTSVHEQVILRQKMMEEGKTGFTGQKGQFYDFESRLRQLQEINIDFATKIQKYESAKQEQSKGIRQKEQQIERYDGKIVSLQTQLNSHKETIKKQELDSHILREKLKAMNQNLCEVNHELITLKMQKKQLQREIQQCRSLYKGKQQISLKLNESQYNQSLQSELEIKIRDLLTLNGKYKNLKRTAQGLKIQNSYMKQRLENINNDEVEVEHMAIDRFIQSLVIFRQKLKQGEAPILANLEKKKDAFIKRMSKEYQDFLVKSELK